MNRIIHIFSQNCVYLQSSKCDLSRTRYDIP
uniref:Uncharacterized protein n=1 Tax=Arundo donax TaxID=35708 RepID=A0A0A8YRF2_ARUDO